jgi:phage terminase large subunit-like protein
VNQPCWVGIDLGATQDMTAAVAVFATEGGSVTVLPKFYLPADGVIERERRYRQPFRQWADQGKLRLTPGAVTDYDYIFHDILGNA